MATNILALANHIQQQGELGRARGTQNRLNRLTGQAMAAPDAQQRDQFVQQAVATDPQSGFALQDRFQSQDDTRAKKAAGAAQYVLNALKSGNPQAVQGAYQTVRPFLVELGRAEGKEPPPAWSPDMEPMLHQVVAASGGKGSLNNPYEGLPSDIQSLRLLQDSPELASLDRERRQAAGMVPKLVETAQGYGWGTPGAGIQLAPLDGVAGQQAPHQTAPAPQLFAALSQKYGIQPTSVTRTPQHNREVGGVANSYHLNGQAADYIVPQQHKAQFAADARANGYEVIDEGDHIHIEPAGQRGAGGAGGIAQPRDKPTEESFSNPQAVLGPDGQQRFVQFGNRGGVREVPGYSAAPTSTATAADRKAAQQAQQKLPQLQNAIRGMDRIGNALRSLSGGMVNTGPMDQYYTRYTKEGQELEAAVGAIQNSVLALTRVPGVGSQSDLEQRVAMLQYPSLDKDPEVNRRTLENLRLFMADLKAAYDNVTGGAQQQGAQQPGAVPRGQSTNSDPLGIL